MELVLGIVTDVHFGPDTYFEGRLRKLCREAPRLLERVVANMNEHVAPDLLVNLGDDIEDQGREADLRAYARCQATLRGARAPVVNVAGNHDLVNLTAADLNAAWRRDGPLHYSFDHPAGYHLVVLNTVERAGVDVRLPAEQLAWLRADLAAARRPALVFMHHSASEQDLDDSRWFRGAPHLCLVAERAELRAVLEQSGRVRAVFNGHLHRNHLDVIGGIPYVTVQSLIENLDDDAPGRVSASHAVVRVTPQRVLVRVLGADPARYQFEAAVPS